MDLPFLTAYRITAPSYLPNELFSITTRDREKYLHYVDDLIINTLKKREGGGGGRPSYRLTSRTQTKPGNSQDRQRGHLYVLLSVRSF